MMRNGSDISETVCPDVLKILIGCLHVYLGTQTVRLLDYRDYFSDSLRNFANCLGSLFARCVYRVWLCRLLI